MEKIVQGVQKILFLYKIGKIFGKKIYYTWVKVDGFTYCNLLYNKKGGELFGLEKIPSRYRFNKGDYFFER